MRIVIIGAGNVATHLAKSLDANHDVVQVYSHTIQNAEILANMLKHAIATNDLSQIYPDADLYIVSVKDDAVASVVDKVKVTSGIWVHTSGSVSIEVLKHKFQQCGVFYPLQTFSRDVEVNMNEVPFFIEACNEDTENMIFSLAQELSKSVHKADSAQRSKLHVAAVFGCNFVNYLWSISSDILAEVGCDLDVLMPLIKVTTEKATSISPTEGQTGPARRGDVKTMEMHEKMLLPEQAKLYRTLSQCIMEKYNIRYEQN